MSISQSVESITGLPRVIAGIIQEYSWSCMDLVRKRLYPRLRPDQRQKLNDLFAYYKGPSELTVMEEALYYPEGGSCDDDCHHYGGDMYYSNGWSIAFCGRYAKPAFGYMNDVQSKYIEQMRSLDIAQVLAVYWGFINDDYKGISPYHLLYSVILATIWIERRMATKYINKYYKSVNTDSPDYGFQEQLRLEEVRNWDKPGRSLGIHALKHAKELSEAEESKKISSELRDLINKSYDEWDKSEKNVRRAVTAIWTYPQVEYMPWCRLEDEEARKRILDACVVAMKKVKPRLELYKGEKVYLHIDGFSKFLADELAGGYNALIDNIPLEPNITDHDHITVIRSSMVAETKYDGSDIDMWNNSGWTVKFTDVKHTISLDWARFSVCLVVDVECPELDSYLLGFNKKYGTNAKPSKHTTIAILPR